MTHLLPNRAKAEQYRKDLLDRINEIFVPESLSGADDSDPQTFYLEFKKLLVEFLNEETEKQKAELFRLDDPHLLLLKRTALVDTIVQTGYQTALWLTNKSLDKNLKEEDVPVAIVARGGYGREEMYFRSDVDIQIVTKPHPEKELAETADIVINFFEYLFVYQDILPAASHSGYSVISPDAMELDEQNMQSFFSLMEGRFVAGNTDVYHEFKDSIKSAQLTHEKEIIRHCSQHKTCYEIQNTVFKQEPNIKDELRRLYWALALIRIREGIETTNQFEILPELLDKKKISPPAFKNMNYGLNFLARARMFLHCYQKGAHRDVMSYEVREKISGPMGYDIKEFYKEYFFNAVLPLKRYSRNLFWESQTYNAEKVRDLSDHFAVDAENQIILTRDPDSYEWNKLSLLLEPFILMAKENYHLSFPVIKSIEQNIDNHAPLFLAENENKEISAYFKKIIEGKFFAKAIRSLHEFRLLETYFIPEFKNITGLLQDIYVHQFPTDIHVLASLDELNKFETHTDRDQFLASLYQTLKNKTAMKLAVLLHDIGKGIKVAGQNEELVGAMAVPRILDKLGYEKNSSVVGEVAFLVEKHLTMADLLLLDPDADDTYDMIWDLVNRDPELLKMLILLTYADRAGTKMKMSSTLIDQLKYFYQNTLYHQERQNVADPVKLEFVKMVQLPRDVQAQLEVYNEFRNSPEHFASAMIFKAEDPSMLIVCSRDQKGLLFEIATILAFNQLNIVEANIHTLENNTLDIFKVNASTGDPIEYSNFFFIRKQVQEDLRNVFVEHRPVDEYYQDRPLIAQESQPKYKDIKLKIKIIGRAVKIETQDILGTVMIQTKVFSDLGMEIQRAVIHTRHDTASNVFYLRPQDVREIIQGEEKFKNILKRELEPVLQQKPVFAKPPVKVN